MCHFSHVLLSEFDFGAGYFNRPGPEIDFFYNEIAWLGSNFWKLHRRGTTLQDRTAF